MPSKSVTRRIRRRSLVQHLHQFAVMLLTVVLLFRLGNMQLEGVSTVVAASLAIVIAFTALMYNRARAVANRKVRFQSLLAAELGLRSALFTIVGTAFVAIVFPFLTGLAYVPTHPLKYPTQVGPILASFVAIVFLGLGLWSFLAAVRVVFPIPFAFPRANRVRRQV